ncbi:DUF4913 domain-containing protein [Cellulomonas sp. NS3]|uniref:DUF4913 domain-containing protein n=1 Tax=Cellulomonas sp. NS3 TaxID=2973977 RepID=UPI0037BFF459
MRHEGPSGPAVWFADYFDPMMAVLTSTTRPFHACQEEALGGHTIPLALPVATPPTGLFRDAGHPDER